MSRLLRDGKYVVFNNNVYYPSGKKSPNEGMVYIISENKDDIQNGFIPINVEYNKKYGFFQCKKEVPKSEITEAYKIRTYVVYRGMEFGIISLDDEFIRIQNECSNDPNDETNKQLRSWGFSEYIRDKFSIIFDKYIPANDPEIKIIEERTEIDISKL